MKDVKPTWVVAVVVTVLFMLSQWVLGRVLGIDYDRIFDSTQNLLIGAVVRVGITAAIFTVIGVFLNRSWGGVYVQDVPRLPGWMWVIPLLLAGAAVLRIAGNDWGARGALYMLLLAIATLFVGIAEETAFRGIVVRALRGPTSNEFAVMVGSSVLFGVMHGINILNGAEVGPTLVQIGIATISGASLYITLRLTGSLLMPILLHGLIDFSILGQIGEIGTLVTIAALVPLLVYLLTIVAAIVIFVSDRRARVQAVPQAT